MNKPTSLRIACILFVFCASTTIASPAQILTTLHSFDGDDGAAPYAGLVQAADGNLYGTTEWPYGTVFKITLSGTLTTLYSFCSQNNCSDGADVYAGLVQASDGNFYGTTEYGGAGDCDGGCGTVFKITPSGTLTTLHSFNGTDGSGPLAPLIQATDGNFYGTTSAGGAGNCNGGCGTVFRLTPQGSLTTLYSFDFTDGANPYAGLVQAADGNFYGTTAFGAVTNGHCYSSGCGTVFKITPSGTLTTLYSFCSSQTNCADGANPEAGLVQASDGNFYGTAYFGGANGDGTVFKLNPGGSFTKLYSFCSQPDCADGAFPHAGLVQAIDENFYGTTYAGGAYNSSYCLGGGCGTVFRITPGGTLTTLYSFCPQAGCADGSNPQAALLQATDGNFYGTTEIGGTYGYGTVFRLVLPRACTVCPSLE